MQGWGWLTLGLLTFIPGKLTSASSSHRLSKQREPCLAYDTRVCMTGFYETRIAYYTWRGYKGYSYDAIPTS